ncbi:MAG: sugar transferase [Campylobacterota bacterium]|nr:sugar transferase [Campylobacterota bacterium]
MKRLFDILFSIILIVLLSPVYIFVMVIIVVSMGTPIVFIQARPGYKEKIFNIYKFRTMSNDVDESGELLEDKDRLTRVGRFIRSTSLDELPQLFNVLRGEMSFVGPRPLLVEYLKLYSDEQKKRHDVKPGITGWAQVNGRNAISWEKKFEHDLWYVQHQSLLLDMKILLYTFLKVIKRDRVSASSDVTMEKFKGSR